MARLAVNGGDPYRVSPFPTWPVYDETERKALERVLRSGEWGTLGPEARRVARRFAAYQHCKHGVAVTNGTVSLELILRALGIGYGDEVVIPPYTFVATVSAVVAAGATPVFADIEPDTFNLSVDSLEEAITPNTKAVIAVHVGGRACDMDRIGEVAARRGLFVIEDAAHAHGSEWKGARVGSLGHAGSFSFQGSKNLNAGEGGMITTNSRKLYEMCWSLHHCGRVMKGTVWYEHPNIGTNARMTEWQAAILNAQMERLDGQIERRMRNAAVLNGLLRETGFIGVPPDDARVTRNSWHLYVFSLDGAGRGIARDAFARALAAEGVPCATGYRCLYRQPALATAAMKRMTGSRIRYAGLRLPNAEHADAWSMWLPQNVLLGTESDMRDIAGAMMKVYENAGELKER